MHPFCSIIILNYQGEKYIQDTIRSVMDLEYPKDRYEIIIVDNGSKDNSRQIINDLAYSTDPSLTYEVRSGPSVRSIFLDKNRGFAAGNNRGISKARGEYIVLLNNDCIVDKNWLKELVKTAEKDKIIFAVNPKVYLNNTNKIQNAGIRIFPNGYAQDIGAIPKNNKQEYEEDRGQYDKEREIDAACAVATLYHKSILDKIGVLDERFFLYYEDVEISERAKKKGYKIIYSPRAKAYHRHAVSSNEGSPFFVYHSERGRLLNLLLHFPFPIFMKEFFLFAIKAKARFIIRLITKPSTTIVNWQYLKVKWYIFLHLPLLLYKKNRL